MPSEHGDIVRSGFDDACTQFTQRIETLGFKRGKKRLWYRLHTWTADFVHFHRCGSSYGALISAEVDIRVHFGIRVFNDPSANGPHLNGPDSDAGRIRAGRYHLRFNAKSGSMFDRCIDDLLRFVCDHGEPWFNRFSEPTMLLELADSPLSESERAALVEAIGGRAAPQCVAISQRLLGVRKSEMQPK